MPRRTEEEANVAGAEAFRGAIVGAAKVEIPRPAARTFAIDSQTSVGSHC